MYLLNTFQIDKKNKGKGKELKKTRFFFEQIFSEFNSKNEVRESEVPKLFQGKHFFLKL